MLSLDDKLSMEALLLETIFIVIGIHIITVLASQLLCKLIAFKGTASPVISVLGELDIKFFTMVWLLQKKVPMIPIALKIIWRNVCFRLRKNE